MIELKGIEKNAWARPTGTASDDNNQRLQETASYMENRYDAIVGLVSESEDNGSNVPDGTPCWRTFWVYDDNLWARALQCAQKSYS